ncbi:hypothetical protein pb186bvf_007066 [Paramecium bursaria]
MLNGNNKGLHNSLLMRYNGSNSFTQQDFQNKISQNLNLKQCSCVHSYAERIKTQLNFSLDILVQSLNNQQYDCQTKTHNIFENNTNRNSQLYKLNSCFRQMVSLEIAIEQILANNTSLIEENLEINLYDSDQPQEVQGFEDAQRTCFKTLDLLKADYQILNIQMSFDQKKIACCGESDIKLWTLDGNTVTLVGETNHKSIIHSVAFMDSQELLAIGDSAGYISTFDTNQILPNIVGFKVHNSSVFYLAYRSINHIISCSDDNTIVTSNLELRQIVQKINYVYPCLSGFDYSHNYDFILAPNDKRLSLYDGPLGNELCSIDNVLQNKFQETFIQIVLSQDSSQALVSLHENRKIFHVKINIESGQMFVKHNINTQGHVQNISWCLDDRAFIHIFDNQYAVRYLNSPNFTLLMQNQLMCCQNINIKQDPKLNYIFTLRRDLAYLGKKAYWR